MSSQVTNTEAVSTPPLGQERKQDMSKAESTTGSSTLCRVSKAPWSFVECKREVNEAHADRRQNLRLCAGGSGTGDHISHSQPISLKRVPLGHCLQHEVAVVASRL